MTFLNSRSLNKNNLEENKNVIVFLIESYMQQKFPPKDFSMDDTRYRSAMRSIVTSIITDMLNPTNCPMEPRLDIKLTINDVFSVTSLNSVHRGGIAWASVGSKNEDILLEIYLTLLRMIEFGDPSHYALIYPTFDGIIDVVEVADACTKDPLALARCHTICHKANLPCGRDAILTARSNAYSMLRKFYSDEFAEVFHKCIIDRYMHHIKPSAISVAVALEGEYGWVIPVYNSSVKDAHFTILEPAHLVPGFIKIRSNRELRAKVGYRSVTDFDNNLYDDHEACKKLITMIAKQEFGE
jgi:hypothetical protein